MKKLLLGLLLTLSFSALADTFVLENADLNNVDCLETNNEVYSMKKGMALLSVSGTRHYVTRTGTASATYTGMFMGTTVKLLEDANICNSDTPYNQTTNLRLTVDTKLGDLWQVIKIEKN